MKIYRGILFATLCIYSLGSARNALGKDSSSLTKPTASRTTTVETQVKASWPTCTTPVCRSTEKGVPNFGRLNANIWRSGQPSREGYANLVKQGLKTVVNLRQEFPEDKDLVPKGVHYVYIPIQDEHAPTQEQAKQFMEVATNSDNWPLLVHCEGGQGRAGVMSGLVRSSLDGWNYDKIMKEVGKFRTKYLGFIVVPMASCQRQFLQNWGAANGPSNKDQIQKVSNTENTSTQ